MLFEYSNTGEYMPSRELISKKMAEFLSAISHPCRIRIIEELRVGEMDVNSLQSILDVSHSSVSQHLSILRAQKAVQKRKDGNHVYYSLTQDGLSEWILAGLDYIEGGMQSEIKIRSAVDDARKLWGHENSKLRMCRDFWIYNFAQLAMWQMFRIQNVVDGNTDDASAQVVNMVIAFVGLFLGATAYGTAMNEREETAKSK